MHLIDTDILVFSLKNDPSVVANFRANAASSHNTTHFSRIDGLRLEDWKA